MHFLHFSPPRDPNWDKLGAKASVLLERNLEIVRPRGQEPLEGKSP